MTPEWEPPRGLNDPLVRRLFIDRATWMRAMRGRIPKIQDRAVAMALGTYGDKDGSSNYPGVDRLVDDLFLSESTVKRCLAWLTENGWLSKVERGDRWAGKSDVYRLTLPAPLAVEMDRWTEEDNGRQWMERPPGEPKRRGMRTRPGPERQGRQGAAATSTPPGDKGPEAEIGVRKDLDTGLSSDTPPEPAHQNLSDHHSELPARPAAHAAGASDDEQADQIAQKVKRELGREISNDGHWQIDKLLGDGVHRRIIIAAVVAAEQQRTTA